MCSPTTCQIASSTHWPSWSQAPFWWGSPKSPGRWARRRRSRSRTRRISDGRSGQHVAAADPPLRPHQPGTLEREQDLLEVGLGQAGALGDVAHRRRACVVGVQREREQRPAGVVTSGRDPHAAMVRRAATAGARLTVIVARDGGLPVWAITPSCPTTPAHACSNIVPAARSAGGARRAAGLDPAPVRDARRSCSCARRPGLGAVATRAELAPTAAARWPGGPSTPSSPSTTATALTSITTGLRRASTASSATASTSTARCSTSCAGRRRRRRPPPHPARPSSSRSRRSSAPTSRSSPGPSSPALASPAPTSPACA